MGQATEKPAVRKPPIDPLDLTVRDLLASLVQTPSAADPDPWVDPRARDLHRPLLAAAQRGEVALSKIGRKFLIRRSELDRWIALQRVPAETSEPQPTAAASPVAHILERAGYRKAAGAR